MNRVNKISRHAWSPEVIKERAFDVRPDMEDV